MFFHASQRLRFRSAVYETTRPQVYKCYRRGFANASQSTRPQVYKSITGYRPTVDCCPSSVVRNSVVPKTPLSPLLARPHPCIPPIGGYLGVVRSWGLQRRRRFFFSDYETTSFLDNGQHSFVLRLLIDKRKIRNSVVPTVHRLSPLVV